MNVLCLILINPIVSRFRYRPHLELSYLSSMLGFMIPDDCVKFLTTMLIATDNVTPPISDIFINGDVCSDKLDVKSCATAFQL